MDALFAQIPAHLAYGAMWAGFGAGHSVLAGEAGLRWLHRRFGARHRLAYNALAAIHLAAVFAAGWGLLGNLSAPALPDWARGAMLAVQGAGWVLMMCAVRGYDLGRLAGTAQARAGAAGVDLPADEPLRTEGLHRYVRHPIYTAGFLVLWGAATDPLGLSTAIWASLYLLVGAAAEERRLLARYGASYAAYRASVPAFVPRWRGQAARPLSRAPVSCYSRHGVRDERADGDEQ